MKIKIPNLEFFVDYWDCDLEMWIDVDGLAHEDLIDLVQSNLGFCCCGDPEENLLYIKTFLKRISLRETLSYTSTSDYFFYYWADSKGYTEHGTAIPGWLTPQGNNLLKILNIIL